jgi:hypothetical protein
VVSSRSKWGRAMREIRTLRATWRGLETWCGSGPPAHTGAPALDPTDGKLAVRAGVSEYGAN